MSVQAVEAVFRHSRAEGGARLVALALADLATESGCGIIPPAQLLMSMTRLSPTEIGFAMQQLQLLRELEGAAGAKSRIGDAYTLLIGGLA